MESATAIDIRTLAAQLTTALGRLRQRDGATRERIQRLRVPGGSAGRYSQSVLDLARLPGSLEEQVQSLHAQIAKTARNLEGTVGQKKVPRREVALCCLGLDEWRNYGDLMTRRTALAAVYHVSPRVVRDWEDQGVIPALADSLARILRKPLEDEDMGYEWVDDDWIFYIDDDGRISAIEFRATVRATRDGIDRVLSRYIYYGDCVRDTLRVENWIHCHVADVQFDGIQQWAVLIELPIVLRKNEEHRLGLHIKMQLTAPSKPFVSMAGALQRRERLRFQIQFGRNRIPRKIWHFDNSVAGVIPAEVDEEKLLYPDAFGYVSHTIREPIEIGGTSGVAWRY